MCIRDRYVITLLLRDFILVIDIFCYVFVQLKEPVLYINDLDNLFTKQFMKPYYQPWDMSFKQRILLFSNNDNRINYFKKGIKNQNIQWIKRILTALMEYEIILFSQQDYSGWVEVMFTYEVSW